MLDKLLAVIAFGVLAKSVVQDEQEARAAAQEEQRRKSSELAFDGIVTRKAFVDLVREVGERTPRVVKVVVEGMTVAITVRSISGLSRWHAEIDFNDYGHLTGRYWLSQDDARSRVPSHVADAIQSALKARRAQAAEAQQRHSREGETGSRAESAMDDHPTPASTVSESAPPVGEVGRGALIASRYMLLREVGRGGMATVWLSRDERLHRDVAIKQLNIGSADVSARSHREARLGAGLRHPNAVAVHDVVVDAGHLWLVMEYVDGQSLAEAISESGRLEPRRVAHIACQVAGALALAHERGIVHRDIKPGNILIDSAGRAKIGDFGIARGRDDQHLTRPDHVVGTPEYMAPEAVRGGRVGPPADVWALGATLYAAVEGHPPRSSMVRSHLPQAGRDTARRGPSIHKGPLAPIIEAMLCDDPAQRWDMRRCAEQLVIAARGGGARVAFSTKILADDTTESWSPPQGVRRAWMRGASPKTGRAPERTRRAFPAALLSIAFAVSVIAALLSWRGHTEGETRTFTCKADGYTGHLRFSNSIEPVVSYKIVTGGNSGGDSADIRVTDGGVTPPRTYQTSEGLQDDSFHAIEGPYSRAGGGISFTFVFDKSNRSDPTCSGEAYLDGVP